MNHEILPSDSRMFLSASGRMTSYNDNGSKRTLQINE